MAEAEQRLREAEERLKPEPSVIRTFRDDLNPEDERLRCRHLHSDFYKNLMR